MRLNPKRNPIRRKSRKVVLIGHMLPDVGAPVSVAYDTHADKWCVCV